MPDQTELTREASQEEASPRILIIDDEAPNTHLLVRILTRAGYGHVRALNDPREALVAWDDEEPDLILLDLNMPHITGLTLLQLLRERTPADTYLPILVLTGDLAPESRSEALSLGARDFLTKPFDREEVLLRIRNLLETRSLHQALKLENQELDRELDEARLEVVRRLALAAEYRDDETGAHTQRVGALAGQTAHVLGLDHRDLGLITNAAPLHDIGKIGIPDSILLKPGPLTDAEFDQMKTHTTIGAGMLSGGRSELLQLAELIAMTHHERWDGTGYPNGLVGDEIPLPGRITAVADVFDCLTHERPYKKAWPRAEAIATLEQAAGTQFDATVVSAFLEALRRSP